MGDTIEQWRATIGHWSGGRPRSCVIIWDNIAEKSNDISYKHIRFVVLVSLLVIGCVEKNPGPNHETSAPTQDAGALSTFRRRLRSVGLEGELYGVKTAAFLFAKALNKTEEFSLASHVDGAGDFGDLIFRYRLKETEVWKTCFIQLCYKKDVGDIQRSSLKKMYGDFSLFRYFKAFCEINRNAATETNLKHCGPPADIQFIIYTNKKMENNSPHQGGDSDPLSILSSGTDCGKYITFDEHIDTDIFGFFENLSKYHKLITEQDSLLKGGTSVSKTITVNMQEFQSYFRENDILGTLNGSESTVEQDYVTRLNKELETCNFKTFKEFLSKVQIFHSQTNEESFEDLIINELRETCKASPSAAEFIYRKYEEGFSKWWKTEGNVEWLNHESELWQAVQNYIITKIKERSEPEIQETDGYGIRFNQQHVQNLSQDIKQNTVVSIVTKSNIRNLQKLKTYQALNFLGYENSLFIAENSLTKGRQEINKFWPSKWVDVLVVECEPNSNVTHRVLDILQLSADIVDKDMEERLVQGLQKYQQKLILISTQKDYSGFQKKLRNVSYFEDNCNISDLDENVQKQILEKPVNFQGTSVPLSELVGTDPTDSLKALIDSDVISILLSKEQEMKIGRNLGDHCKHYVPRVLQHQIHLRKDILKLLTDKDITFAVSGLQAEELKSYLPAGEKVCDFVYDEIERNHTFMIVCDLYKTGLDDQCGTMMTQNQLGQKMASHVKIHNICWNENTGIEISDKTKINTSSTVRKPSKTGLSDGVDNIKAYNEAGQYIKPDDVRFIILANNNPESEFEKLKELCENLHWIHVENGSFLWRGTNCHIDTIRKYIDDTKFETYNMQNIVKHNDRTMLLVAEPGMGKSTFLSHMAREIKKLKPSVWVLRINLNEHTNELKYIEFEKECFGKCKNILWAAIRANEPEDLRVEQEIFLRDLQQTGNIVIILDGYDEISPDYSHKGEMLIRTIKDETASKVWISSRFAYRHELEDIVGKFAFILLPFTKENQIQFLEEYWSKNAKVPKQNSLKMYAEKLLSLCSQNFSEKDGDFNSIPLQTLMLGESFINEANAYTGNGEFNLPEKLNLLDLFEKFTERKFSIYCSISDKMGIPITEAESDKKDYEEKHMISALLYLFPEELNKLLGIITESNLDKTKRFLGEGKAQKFGIIPHTMDGNPNFIHPCFAQYFAAKWFADNFGRCKKFISDILFKPRNEVTRNIFDRILAEESIINGAVLNNDIHVLNEILKEKRCTKNLDKGSRTALHLAASYNSSQIQLILSFQFIDVNIPDAVLNWTPLTYAERTKSWMAMDILLQNGANPDDITFTKNKAETQEWGQAAVWECASKGHIKLLEFMLNCGIQVNAHVSVPENAHKKFTLLHRASYYGQVEVVRLLVERGAKINTRDTNNNTALHLAAESGSVDIINLLLDSERSVNLTGENDSTPLHISVQFGQMDAVKALVKRGADINSTDNSGTTPHMMAAWRGKLEIFQYFRKMGADINHRDAENNTALHFASVSGCVDIITLLLDVGMSVNVCNTDGYTPLHFSAELGHLEATKILVDRGASFNEENENGDTPLALATKGGNINLINFLTEIGAVVNNLDA